MIEKTFLSKDEKSTIHYYIWEPEGQPKAVLQIVHGMAEHILRYADFAEYLSSQGILVCGNDHIGHGRSADPKDWGYFGENDGWRIMIQDVEQLHGIMKVQHMDCPYFILGHSMGSFIVRAWLAMIGRGIDGAIIMGTSGSNSAIGVAKTLVSTLRKTQGSRHISRTVTGLAFGSYNKRIKPQRTDYDWLTRDDAIVDKYIEDPACGFTFTLAGYSDLFNVIAYVSSDSWYKLVPKDLPLLIVSGTEDPVGSYGKGPAEVAEKLEEYGCSDVSLILYEGMRHEILNEIGKETVYDDIRRFILDEGLPGDGEEPDDQDADDYQEAGSPADKTTGVYEASSYLQSQAAPATVGAAEEPTRLFKTASAGSPEADSQPAAMAQIADELENSATHTVDAAAAFMADPALEPAEVPETVGAVDIPPLPEVPELKIPDFDAEIRASEPEAPAAPGLGLSDLDTQSVTDVIFNSQAPENQPEKTGLSDADSDMVTNIFTSQAAERSSRHEEAPSRDYDFPEFSREEEKSELEKVVDSYKSMGAQIEFIKSEAAEAPAEKIPATEETEPVNTVSKETEPYIAETAERSNPVTSLDEKIFHDTTPQDNRISEERAFDAAEDLNIPIPDFSGNENENVPHRGIRSVDFDHTAEWVEGTVIERDDVDARTADDDSVHYVPEMNEERDEDERTTIDEAVFNTATTDVDTSRNFWEEEKPNVAHRGIRWLVEGFDAEWNAAHPTVGPARGVIKRASEKAEELAAKYDVPDNVKRLADRAEALASKYDG